VTGHIPLLSLQSTQSGRGREYIYVGRCQDAHGGTILLNPETNRTVTIRRTFKVMGDHPVSNALFDQPLEMFLGDDLADDSTTPISVSSNVPPSSMISTGHAEPDETLLCLLSFIMMLMMMMILL
jgi:hypothetical protein